MGIIFVVADNSYYRGPDSRAECRRFPTAAGRRSRSRPPGLRGGGMHNSRISIQRCYKALPRRGGAKSGIPTLAVRIGVGLCRMVDANFGEVIF
jgi:hypothetical protein